MMYLVETICGGGNGGEDRLTENVTLNFARVKVDYNSVSLRHCVSFRRIVVLRSKPQR